MKEETRLSKKSEFVGQVRVTPEHKDMIRKALEFYGRNRGEMAAEVMSALFYHYLNGDKVKFPLRFADTERWMMSCDLVRKMSVRAEREVISGRGNVRSGILTTGASGPGA